MDNCKICEQYERCLKKEQKLKICMLYTKDMERIKNAVEFLELADYKVFSSYQWDEIVKKINNESKAHGHVAYIDIYDLNQIFNEKL